MTALFPDITEPVAEPFPGVQCAQRPVIVELPGVGERKGAAVPFEELHAQFFFKVLDAQRQGGLGDEELFGGFRDALFLCCSHYVLKLIPVHGEDPFCILQLLI